MNKYEEIEALNKSLKYNAGCLVASPDDLAIWFTIRSIVDRLIELHDPAEDVDQKLVPMFIQPTELVRKCTDCKFAIMQDFGYSNYTVEGTTFVCANRVHPAGDFDRFYGEEPNLLYATRCTRFMNGEPVNIDVECEALSDLRGESKEIYDQYIKSTGK